MYADMMDTIGFVKQADPAVGEAMERELARQRRNLELIASENIVSPAVMAAMGSVLTNKYATMAAARKWMWWKTSPATAHASCLARNTPMYRRTPAPKPTRPRISR